MEKVVNGFEGSERSKHDMSTSTCGLNYLGESKQNALPAPRMVVQVEPGDQELQHL
jgi:hypothetical protein